MKYRKRGTGTVNNEGRVYIGQDGVRKSRAVRIVEAVLGYSLPCGTEVHHVDGNPSNDISSNLVVCPSKEYHWLLHRRQRALDACGNANWYKCKYCNTYDEPSNLTIGKHGQAKHKICHTNYELRRRNKMRLKIT